MARGAAAMEQAAGTLRGFDAIGLCFPDVVIRNRIVGGETYKTRGMRENAALDYEAQFAKITDLCMLLQAYTVPSGVVMYTGRSLCACSRNRESTVVTPLQYL